MKQLINNLAQLKRALVPGVTLTMVRHDWYPGGKLMNEPRAITHKQSNAIRLGTSWLYWGPASTVTDISSDGFTVILDPNTGKSMAYTIDWGK